MTSLARFSPTSWSERAWGWVGPLGVALLAFGLRIWRVGKPRILMFDETYYAKDAWSLLQHGYVQDFTESANKEIENGRTSDLMTGDPSWIVHPDGGKWLIAIGEHLFGLDAFGWRIAAVVIGSLTVLVLARLVRRITGSTVMGCVAGLLLAVDGLHFVMSRMALLDVFLAFWVVCGVACLVADRDWIRARLDRYRVVRPWQLLAGVSFGMACGTKWNGIYVLAAFGVLAVVWEVLARRRGPADPAIRRSGWIGTTLRVGIPAFASIVVVAGLVYVATWTGFLIHHDAYEARFGNGYGEYSAPWGAYVDKPTPGFLGETRDAFRSLWHFHVMTFDFSWSGLDNAEKHPYESNPVGWLVMERPVLVEYQGEFPASECGATAGSSCVRSVLILGNPIIWWTGVLALLAAVVAWVVTRSWRWGVPVVAVAVSWLPWFMSTDRPIFSYYAVAIIPFTIVAITLVIHEVVRTAETPRHRYVVWCVAGFYVTAAVVAFWFFHPVLSGEIIPYDTWHDRMWFDRWI
ncbi:phospholipid carrier-dependent glycosyltransferase [Aeromicrobium sp. NPDC092404]|uniref:dolichyl-phosphate-mannose--protein mannosyltransferase n=1 Tax=Aeromicrobium sp. NPDC092404 TaxID=3154976 RepID=UPI003415FEDF